MLDHNLNELDDWCAVQMARLAPQAQRRLLREIGDYIRKQNRARIAAQRSPEGKKWPPRKPNVGDGKGKMFRKLRQNKHFKIRIMANQLRVGWFAKQGHIANVHHYGLRDQLKYGIAEYPERPLLGITADDQAGVRDIMMRHLTEGA